MTDFRKRGFFAVDTGRKLNVHKTFRRCPGRLLNVLYTFNLRPVSAGLFIYHLFLLFLCFYFGRKIVKTPFVLILENYEMVSLKFLWPGHLKRIAQASNRILPYFPYSAGMRENTDQKKLRIWTLFTQWIYFRLIFHFFVNFFCPTFFARHVA